jgi:hypothetical protein
MADKVLEKIGGTAGHGTFTITDRSGVAEVGADAVAASGAIKSSGATSSAGIGYATGAGGVATTQASARTNAVTCNAACGSIALHSEAGVTTVKSFDVNNSVVVPSDVVIVNQATGANPYNTYVSGVTTGKFTVSVVGTTTATDAPVLNFAVIKAVTS